MMSRLRERRERERRGGGGGGRGGCVDARGEVGATSPGLKVLPKPAKLDASLVGKLVYLRWESPAGWVLGTVKDEEITRATPCLFKKFNYRVAWIVDKSKGPATLQACRSTTTRTAQLPRTTHGASCRRRSRMGRCEAASA